jgi:hypothetical protein
MLSPRGHLLGADLSNAEVRLKPNGLAALAHKGWIGHPGNWRKPRLPGPTSDRIHVGARAEPDEESLHAAVREERDQLLQAFGRKPLFRSAEVTRLSLAEACGPW